MWGLQWYTMSCVASISSVKYLQSYTQYMSFLSIVFPHSSLVKNLPAMQETQDQFVGCKDLLEKEMATHSSILAWRIPWTEEPGKLHLNTFIFNWRIVALQCCIDFCCISTWTSHRYAHVTPFLNVLATSNPIPPLQVFTEHRVELPTLYSKFPLALCFTHGHIYISRLLFPFVPPSSFLAVSTSLFSIHVSLVLPYK